jgi:hypothetical protein
MQAYRAAFTARDHAALVDMFAPDIVFRSAVTDTPFRGRDEVADLYRVVLEVLTDIEFTDELADGTTQALFWRGWLQGRPLEGVDRFRFDEHGKIREITLMGRPLAGIATLASAIGPRLARRRGRASSAVARLVTRPLPAMLAFGDSAASRLLRPRS